MMSRINLFLNERTEGEKYATVFYCTVKPDGISAWANAGHCTPILVRANGEFETSGDDRHADRACSMSLPMAFEIAAAPAA